MFRARAASAKPCLQCGALPTHFSGCLLESVPRTVAALDAHCLDTVQGGCGGACPIRSGGPAQPLVYSDQWRSIPTLHSTESSALQQRHCLSVCFPHSLTSFQKPSSLLFSRNVAGSP